ncbi:MAG TPA: hypothetical protein VF586_01170, partial [Pyrinomonadaceae bacterium]
MSEEGKDELPALRAAQEQLSARITRISLVRIAFLFIIVFTLPNALDRVANDDRISKLRRDLYKASAELAKLSAVEAGHGRMALEEEGPGESDPDTAAPPAKAQAGPSPPPAESQPTPPPAAALTPIEQLVREVEGLLASPKVQSYLGANAGYNETTDWATYIESRRLLRALEGEPEVQRYMDARGKLSGEYELLQDQLANLQKEAWSIQFSFLGTGPKLDLRKWIYLLPFLFILTEVYVQIYRRKLDLLYAVASCRISQSAHATALDKLLFQSPPGRVSEYARHPADLEKWLYLLTLLFLAGYLWASGTGTPGYLFYNWTERPWGHYGHMVVTAVFYATAYYVYASSRMEAQVREVVGAAPRPTAVVAGFKKTRVIARLLVRRLRGGAALGRPSRRFFKALRRAAPRLTAAAGCLLLFATLGLAVGVTQLLGGRPNPYWSPGLDVHTGYELLRWRKDVWWYSAAYLIPRRANSTDSSLNEGSRGSTTFEVVEEPEWEEAGRALGVAAYGLSLASAALSAAFIVLSLFRRRLLEKRRLGYALFAASALILLHVILDFAFSSYWFQGELFPLRLLVWAAAGAAAVRSLYLPADGPRQRRMRKLLTVLLAPLIFNACGLLTNAVLWARLNG